VLGQILLAQIPGRADNGQQTFLVN